MENNPEWERISTGFYCNIDDLQKGARLLFESKVIGKTFYELIDKVCKDGADLVSSADAKTANFIEKLRKQL